MVTWHEIVQSLGQTHAPLDMPRVGEGESFRVMDEDGRSIDTNIAIIFVWKRA